MKIIYLLIPVFFCAQQEPSSAAIVRRAPAFATPIYSNSYLPAAMQVIFHAVNQLKNLESTVDASTSTTTTTTSKSVIEATSPHAPGQHQPIVHQPVSSSTINSDGEVSGVSSYSIEASTATAMLKTTTSVVADPPSSPITFSRVPSVSPVTIIESGEVTTTTMTTDEITSDSSPSITLDAVQSFAINDESTINPGSIRSEEFDTATDHLEAETPEQNYATAETNHEVQESSYEVAETNQEVAEDMADGNATYEYEAKITTAMPKDDHDASDETSSEESDEENNSSEEKGAGRNGSDSSEESKEDENDSAEEEDEIRFSMIGEKVSQVPRPSLSSYLRKTVKSPLRDSTQQLAALYDALSKDARKQGLAKYSGYADEVLKTLETSAEGGIGSQMRILLEKTLKRKELTRDDAKSKLTSTLKKLNDPGSALNRDLRTLIPLRYVP